ncbi:MAG TPA: YaiI/YqxD family protein, partial [Gammaproteobacteria bacterium]|nr:YaiI/YqxD family protein [Gammaproteobacteria bacterium]
MQIWVDADACPRVIRDILFRAVARTGVTLTLVANQPLQ